MFPAHESGNEHDEGAFGEVEVGDEGVYTLEFVGRIDKDGSIAAAGAKKTVFVGDRFQRADGGRPDGDDAPALPLGGIDDVRRLLRNAVVFGVHDVVGEVLLFYGAEGTQPHVKEHFRYLHAHVADLLQELLGKVQARRGRGGRAVRLAVHRLIAVLIFELFVNVRRQRHTSHAGKDVLEHPVKMELDDTFARRRPAFDSEGELFGDDKFCPLLRLFPGADKHFPIGQILPFEQQNLYTSPVFRVREHTRGEHFCIVDDEHVARL